MGVGMPFQTLIKEAFIAVCGFAQIVERDSSVRVDREDHHIVLGTDINQFAFSSNGSKTEEEVQMRRRGFFIKR